MYGAAIATSCQVEVHEAAEEPGVDLAELVRMLLLHEGLKCRHERCHGDAGEDERSGRARASRASAEHVGAQDGNRRAGERRQGDEPFVCRRVRDRERRTETCTRRHSEEVRVRERVPENALIRRAGDCERTTDESCERDARRA